MRTEGLETQIILDRLKRLEDRLKVYSYQMDTHLTWHLQQPGSPDSPRAPSGPDQSQKLEKVKETLEYWLARYYRGQPWVTIMDVSALLDELKR